MNYFHLIQIILLGLIAVKVFLLISFSESHLRRKNKKDNKFTDYHPLVSVILPSYNEEMTLKNSVNSILAQSYQNIEIVIVDDGSKDNTLKLAGDLDKKYNKVRALAKQNGGKASALNYGIEHSQGAIVVCVDADSVLGKNTIASVVERFADDDVDAVGGNVKVVNRDTILTRHQAIEYVCGLNLQRRCFACLGCSQVIPGAIGAFRKKTLLKVGGYSDDTLVEDMDVTVTIARNGGRVDFDADAVAYTEAPESINSFYKQRYRWAYGTFQVLKKHGDMLFNPKYGKIGIIGLPYIALFPFIDLFISLAFFFDLVTAFLAGNLFGYLYLVLVFTMLQFMLTYYALSFEKEDRKLSVMSLFEYLWYNHLIVFINFYALVNFLIGKKSSWNKFERLGKNVVPNISLS